MAKLIDFDIVACDEILFESTSLQSYGYGIVSQLVTKDRDISVAAKGVYAYLVSCAGNDKQTYPSQEKMCYDLNIKNVKTLRKYIKELQSKGFIRIVKTKKNNIQYRNVYLIAMDTRSIEVWKRQFEEGIEADEAETLEKPKKDNKKDLSVGADKPIEKTSTEIILNDSIAEKTEKENRENLETDNIDYEQLAIERCKREIEGFENMNDIRKDVNIGIMLQRIARGE
nr:MAG TPA: helix-turn-helix domain protein [Caudoviricetes sp.]